jgi:hypothetical protein
VQDIMMTQWTKYFSRCKSLILLRDWCAASCVLIVLCVVMLIISIMQPHLCGQGWAPQIPAVSHLSPQPWLQRVVQMR